VTQDQAIALWKQEEQFWLGSADFYESNLATESLMVLPKPVGILGREATIDSIRSGSRWGNVSFNDRHCVLSTPETAALAYMVHTDRGSPDTSYVAQCSSTYVRANGQWLLVMHHQTPAD
jgi:hypothetical protein